MRRSPAKDCAAAAFTASWLTNGMTSAHVYDSHAPIVRSWSSPTASRLMIVASGAVSPREARSMTKGMAAAAPGIVQNLTQAIDKDDLRELHRHRLRAFLYHERYRNRALI